MCMSLAALCVTAEGGGAAVAFSEVWGASMCPVCAARALLGVGAMAVLDAVSSHNRRSFVLCWGLAIHHRTDGDLVLCYPLSDPRKQPESSRAVV